MPLLLAALPWYWKVAAAAAFALGLLAFGFAKGVSFEADRRDAADAKALAEGTRILVREVTKIEVRYVERKQKREAERAAITQEVIAHAASIPDPATCWLAPDRVRTINRAWASPDPGSQAGSVPAAGGVGVRVPQ